MKMRISWTLPADLTAEATAFASGDYLLVQKSGAEEVSKINGSTLGGLAMLYTGAAGLGIQSRSGADGAFTESAWNIDYQGWDATYGLKFKIWGWDEDGGYIRTTGHFTASAPVAIGTAAGGSSQFMSRGDHVHPSTPASARAASLGSASLPWSLVYVSSGSGNLGILHGTACYTTASDGWKFRVCDTSGTLSNTTVDVTCDSLVETSDERLKTDIVASDLGLNFVMGLNPVRYRRVIGGQEVSADAKGDPITVARPGVRPHYGFLAGEIKTLAGDADFGGYVESADGEKGLRYSEFFAPLVKAVQELHGQVQEERQARLALEQRLAVLEMALGPIGAGRAKA